MLFGSLKVARLHKLPRIAHETGGIAVQMLDHFRVKVLCARIASDAMRESGKASPDSPSVGEEVENALAAGRRRTETYPQGG
jgi:hypothetical protein